MCRVALDYYRCSSLSVRHRLGKCSSEVNMLHVLCVKLTNMNNCPYEVYMKTQPIWFDSNFLGLKKQNLLTKLLEPEHTGSRQKSIESEVEREREESKVERGREEILGLDESCLWMEIIRIWVNIYTHWLDAFHAVLSSMIRQDRDIQFQWN